MQARRIDTARFSFDPSDSTGNSAARWPLGFRIPSFPGALFFTADVSWFCLVVYRKYWADSFPVEVVVKAARQGRSRSEFVLRCSGAGGTTVGCGRFGKRRLPLQEDHRRETRVHVRRQGAIAG